jgi:Gram-negative bacterial TonB protein C-terminal
MRCLFTELITSLIWTAILPCAVAERVAQKLAHPTDSETGVVAIKLLAPTYPPLARAAHVTGDVDLMLGVRQDGSIESATVVSGTPLLSSAALDSAQHAMFDCRNCTQAVNPYRLVYTFQIEDTGACTSTAGNSQPAQRDQTYPPVTDAQHRVTVTAEILCIFDPWASGRAAL